MKLNLEFFLLRNSSLSQGPTIGFGDDVLVSTWYSSCATGSKFWAALASDEGEGGGRGGMFAPPPLLQLLSTYSLRGSVVRSKKYKSCQNQL